MVSQAAFDGGRVVFCELVELGSRVIAAGVDEVGRASPTLGGERAKAQRLATDHELDELLLVGFHRAGAVAWLVHGSGWLTPNELTVVIERGSRIVDLASLVE